MNLSLFVKEAVVAGGCALLLTLYLGLMLALCPAANHGHLPWVHPAPAARMVIVVPAGSVVIFNGKVIADGRQTALSGI